MSFDILDKINSPKDLKDLDSKQIPSLCQEIREFLVEKVKKSGGHLASNLGVVELSVALHRVFDSPEDHIIFDVGHQSYVHKIITGRKDGFDDLRKPGGLSGFTARRESEHDPFGAGHSSTSVSAALGFAESDALAGRDNYTVCVIGDGAYTGGMVHEAINNCRPDLRMIIVLNENGMSISDTKGAFASYLSRVRMSKGYLNAKSKTGSFLHKIPLLGRPIKWILSGIKNLFKLLFFRPNYFEELGFYYLGAYDGNDYQRVEKALTEAKRVGKCVIVHLKTTKGKGFDEAEKNPDIFHSVSSGQSEATYHEVFADKLVELAQSDDKILAITPAMGIGTGLNLFEKQFPDRYFDVGIAEEHALTFSAGLAANGYKPYAAIYSTFLQRGYDNILHDIALQNLPVRMVIDRAGISAGDGATHHGIFDVSFLCHIPGIEVISPASFESLSCFLDYSQGVSSPIAIRYPNAKENSEVVSHFESAPYTSPSCKADFDISNPPTNIYITYGQLSSRVLEAKRLLESRGIDVGILLVERIKPFDDTVALLSGICGEDTRIVYAEEGIKNGGAAMITHRLLCESGVKFKSFSIAAIEDSFVIPDAICDIYDYAGLSPKKLADYFLTEQD